MTVYQHNQILYSALENLVRALADEAYFKGPKREARDRALEVLKIQADEEIQQDNEIDDNIKEKLLILVKDWKKYQKPSAYECALQLQSIIND